MYADDLALISKSVLGLQQSVHRFSTQIMCQEGYDYQH